jgi:glycosyltransferase involved in cell wall biosynthesis
VQPLKILHVLRAPVGGLFRHVADLARGQAARGHHVGLVADATTGAARAEAILADLAPVLTIGVRRIAMSRHLGLSDVAAARAVKRLVAASGARVVHGHGAKGGAYARLAGGRGAIRVYTPHGGSLHYAPGSPLGLLYLTAERALMPRTDLLLFESDYGRRVFTEKISKPKGLSRVVHNGVEDGEFAPVTPDAAASDLVFVGELRMLKGVDVLIDAVALLRRRGTPVSATIVGDGPDAPAFRRSVQAAGLGSAVHFVGALPARDAFALGRVLVVPSRAESLPYIVLEAAAACRPMIATNVGGIPEIFGPQAARLIPPADAEALAAAIAIFLSHSEAAAEDALQLQHRVRASFSAEAMTDQIIEAYSEALTKPGAALLRSH